MKEIKTQVGSQKKKSVKAEANAHEQELANKLGGFRQPMSGALIEFKGDISLDKFLLDSKQTRSGSILITAKDLTKINREAYDERKTPGLVLTLVVPDTVPSEWVLIPLDMFAILVKE